VLEDPPSREKGFPVVDIAINMQSASLSAYSPPPPPRLKLFIQGFHPSFPPLPFPLPISLSGSLLELARSGQRMPSSSSPSERYLKREGLVFSPPLAPERWSFTYRSSRSLQTGSHHLRCKAPRPSTFSDQGNLRQVALSVDFFPCDPSNQRF